MANANSYQISYYGANGNSNLQLSVREASTFGSANLNSNTLANIKTVALFGRNYTEGGTNGYGRIINQNYVTLLENSANTHTNHANTTLYPQFITGQLVFETTTANANIVPANTLYLFTSTGTYSGASKVQLLSNVNPPHAISWGNSHVNISSYSGNIVVTANNTTIATITSNDSTTGNINIDIGTQFNYNYDTSNGSLGNLTVDRFIANSSSNSAGQFIGNGWTLSSLNGGNVDANTQVPNALVAGTVYTADQPNITSVGTLGNLLVAGSITANVITSNGNLSGATITSSGNLTGNVGALGTLSITGAITSTLATGTAPLVVNSTTKVANLNVDLIDDYQTSIPAVASTVVVRDTNASINANAVVGNTLTGSLTTAAQPNITSLGTLTGLTVGGTGIDGIIVAGNQSSITNMGNVTFSGNITVGGLINGSLAGNAVSNVTGGNATFSSEVEAPTGTFTTTVETPSANITNVFVTTGNITTVNSTTLNSTTLNSTNATITTGNITTVNSTTINSTTVNGNLVGTTANVTTVNTTNVNATTVNGNLVGTTANVTTVNSTTVNGNLVGTTANVTTVNSTDVNATTVKATTLTTGASGTGGTITGNWTLSSGSRMQSTYADLAEYYSSELNILPGTVVEFGGAEEIQLCDTRNSTRIAGVVSTDPAYIMNEKLGQTVPRILVALIGRVPCKVYGVCSKGDLMVAAGGGYAMANNSPAIGSVIGKALEDKATTGVGTIEVVVGRV